MREEIVETEFEYDEEGRVKKKTVTRTYKRKNRKLHPFINTYFEDDNDGYRLM